MGIYRGPNIIKDSLVFGYDADDRSSRFYKGEPTTNISTKTEEFISGSNLNENGTYAYSSGTIISSTIAPNDSKFLNAYHLLLTNGSSSYDLYRTYNGLTVGDIYTFSIYVKLGTATNFCIVPNNSAAWNTVSGAYTFTNLNTKTYTRVSITFTIPSTGAINIHLGAQLEGITQQTPGTIYITGAQFEKKSHPTQYLRNSGLTSVSRTNTDSLVDLKRTSLIDVSNMSFDTTGHPIFDGVNDYMSTSLGLVDFSKGITIESMVRFTNTASWARIIDFGNGSVSDNILFARYGTTNNISLNMYVADSQVLIHQVSNSIVLNETCLFTAVISPTDSRIYKNGVLISTMSNSYVPNYLVRTNSYIGKSNWADEYFKGNIHTLKIYNKPLTSSEIQQNYNAIKSRIFRLGLSYENAAESALQIKTENPLSENGVYWINLPTVGPTQIYCIMDSNFDGGGWMMMLKSTAGTTFNYDATYWTTNNKLNETDTTIKDGDAKFDVMNYYPSKDIMARFPDINVNGGSIPNTGKWTWLQNNFYGGTKIVPITLFSTVNRYFIKDAKTFSGWGNGVFSSQTDVRFYGFNYINDTGDAASRWGFGWNENGGGLYPNGNMGSDDVSGGIGLRSSFGTYSAGDKINCCADTTGINRSARVEIYVR